MALGRGLRHTLWVHSNAPRGAYDLPQVLLTFSVFAYVLAVFIASSFEGFSRLVHVSIAFNMLTLFLVGWRRGLKVRHEPVLFFAWLFCVFALASIFWSLNQGAAFASSLGLFFDVLGATGVLLSLWNGSSLRPVVLAAIIGAGFNAVVGLHQFYVLGFARAAGLTGNANAFAIQLSIAALLVLIMAKRSWLPPLIAVAMVLVATIVSGSRKMVFVWISLLLLFLPYLNDRLRQSRIYLASFLLLLPIGLIVAAQYQDQLIEPATELGIYQRFERALEGRDGSANTRNAMIAEGLRLWQESPFWGHGTNQFRHASPIFNTYSHNNYTETLANFGLIGFALYHAVILFLLVRSGIGLFNGLPHARLIMVSIFLILMWAIALVSYNHRLIWLFLFILTYLSLRPSNSKLQKINATNIRVQASVAE
jgi:O-antigen ligase